MVEAGTRSVTFSAPVSSEEDLGETIKARLLIDYGVVNPVGAPFLGVIRGPELPVAVGAEGRRVAVDWLPAGVPVAPGCHTFTLMASHAFDETTDCPIDLADSSYLTWHVYVCADDACEVGDPRFECPRPKKSCPERAALADWPRAPDD